MKIGVCGADFGDPVLPHDRRNVQIVKARTRHVWVLTNQLADHEGVARRFDEDSEGGKRV